MNPSVPSRRLEYDVAEPDIAEPAVGERAIAQRPVGEPAGDKPASGEPAIGGPEVGGPAVGELAVSEPSVGPRPLSRRRLLGAGVAAVAGGVLGPFVWIPRPAFAGTTGRGSIKHLLYIRLASGFRFTAGFNGDVAAEFNPYGAAPSKAAGAEWGVSALLARASFLSDATQALNMKAVPDIADQITVIPCVDHEPAAASADGNHGTGLERFYTGYVGGKTGFFTMITYGLRTQIAQAQANGQPVLPPFVLGGAGMGRGFDQYAAYRPPILGGTDFDQFKFQADGLADWANRMAGNYDMRMRDRQHPSLRGTVDAYLQSRSAATSYGTILSDPVLKIGARSTTAVDGISNKQLADAFGTTGAGQRVHLALRLFHFGCPAVYLDQGGYDFHSQEDEKLPLQFDELNRIISGLEAVLKIMTHPAGGTYWDHTVVAFGSEFSRTTRGSKFNSARGSDHGGDYETRWMSMPFMGGPIVPKGRTIGSTGPSDLKPSSPGDVRSYRSVLKTLMDGLGCDHQEFFPEDEPFDDLYT